MERGLSLIKRHCDDPLDQSSLIKLIDDGLNKYKYNTFVFSKETKQSMSYENIVEEADNLAAGLIELGLKPGDKIGLIINNSIEGIIANFACIRGGFVAVNLNPALQQREMEHCIKIAQINCMIMLDRYKVFNIIDILKKIIPEIEDTVNTAIKSKDFPYFQRVVLIAEQLYKGTSSFKSVIALGKSVSKDLLKEYQSRVTSADYSHIIFTSGTTGSPKAVAMTHLQINNTVIFFGKRVASDKKPTRFCFVLPLFHVFGLGFSLITLKFGNTLVLPSLYYSAESTLDAISNDHCSIIMGTPTMLADLVRVQRIKKFPLQIDEAHCGGAPGSEKLFREVMTVLNVKRLSDGYGATEALAISWPLRGEEIDFSSRCVGHLMEHLEAKVVDPNGKIVPFGTVGELCVRGYSVIKGYLDGDSSVFDKDGWYQTGDAVFINEDGKLYMMGRMKEIINRGGEKVSPVEVEEILLTHGDILEVSVIGTKHERLGEEVCACIILKGDAELTLADIKDFCTGKLSYYKIPSRIEIMDQFPKTLMGKVKKAELVEKVNLLKNN